MEKTEDPLVVQDTQYVLFDNGGPFFSIPCYKVNRIEDESYAGLDEKGIAQLVTAAYDRDSLKNRPNGRSGVVACQLWELSTGHISRNTAKLPDDTVSEDCADDGLWPLVVYPKAAVGWLVMVPSHDLELTLERLPEELAHIVKLGAENDVRWIMFDCDAYQVEGLPVFDW